LFFVVLAILKPGEPTGSYDALGFAARPLDVGAVLRKGVTTCCDSCLLIPSCFAPAGDESDGSDEDRRGPSIDGHAQDGSREGSKEVSRGGSCDGSRGDGSRRGSGDGGQGGMLEVAHNLEEESTLQMCGGDGSPDGGDGSREGSREASIDGSRGGSRDASPIGNRRDKRFVYEFVRERALLSVRDIPRADGAIVCVIF
jgi:hypothetical protein